MPDVPRWATADVAKQIVDLFKHHRVSVSPKQTWAQFAAVAQQGDARVALKMPDGQRFIIEILPQP